MAGWRAGFEEGREEKEWIKVAKWQREDKVIFVAYCWSEEDKLRFFAWGYIKFPGAVWSNMYSIWYKMFRSKRHYMNWKRLVEKDGWDVMYRSRFDMARTGPGGRYTMHWEDLLCPEEDVI